MCRNYFSTFFPPFQHFPTGGGIVRVGGNQKQGLFWRRSWPQDFEELLEGSLSITIKSSFHKKKSVANFIIFLCFSFKEAPSCLIRPCFFLWMLYPLFSEPPQNFHWTNKKQHPPFSSMEQFRTPSTWATKKPWLFRLYGIILPNYMGIIINHYEDSC